MRNPVISMLRYPLHLECVSGMLFLCLLFYFLVLIALFSYTITMGAPLYVMGSYMLLMLINSFFEYGLEVIDESALGKATPPTLPLNFFDILKGRGRFKRQLLMLLFFGVIIWQLFAMNLVYLALAILIFTILVFPASLLVNALYEDFFEIINPLTLIGVMLITGWQYVAATGLLFALILALVMLFIASWVTFLFILPLGLYGFLVYFRYLGLIACAHSDALHSITSRDLEEAAVEQFYADNAMLHKVLEDAYWNLKDRRVDAAIKLLTPVISIGGWARFEAVFGYISQWPVKRPALHFIRLYLSVLRETCNSMRALSLCEWSLNEDAEFTVADESLLHWLEQQSVSQPQYVVTVKLLSNFARQYPGHEASRAFLLRAAEICQGVLKHPQKFAELQEQLLQLDSA